MSSSVNVDICLISCSKFVPKQEMEKLFYDSVNELGGTLVNSILSLNGKRIGKVSMSSRIVVQTYSENASFVKQSTEELRNIFTRRSQIVNKNYLKMLEDKKKQIEQSDSDFIEFEKKIKSINKEIEDTSKAAKRQQLSSCEAIKEELIESAINKGYDVVEDNVNGEIQLQFVRREY